MERSVLSKDETNRQGTVNFNRTAKVRPKAFSGLSRTTRRQTVLYPLDALGLIPRSALERERTGTNSDEHRFTPFHT
jgi:hypothetical protein